MQPELMQFLKTLQGLYGKAELFQGHHLRSRQHCTHDVASAPLLLGHSPNILACESCRLGRRLASG